MFGMVVVKKLKSVEGERIGVLFCGGGGAGVSGGRRGGGVCDR